MLHRSQRARRRPGPLTLIAFIVGTIAVQAHDPGLSSLEVTASAATISVTLSLSAADVAQLVATTGAGAQEAVRHVVRDAIDITFGDEVLSLDADRIEIGADGARVHLEHAMTGTNRSGRLIVASRVPARLSRGHRELVIINAGGRVVSERILDANANSVAVDLVVAQPSVVEKAWSFLTLGVEHILSGYDHLAFLAGLILAAVTLRELALALTAFTAAHSLSLALVVIGGAHISPSIVEPLIAASIAWIGIENLLGSWKRRQSRSRQATTGDPQPTGRWWLVFGFGLIHGFGFAGGLMELGFGSSARDIAIALLSFNGGVEIGQLAVALALLPVVRLMRSRPAWRATLVPLCSSLIVVAGSYWLVERLW